MRQKTLSFGFCESNGIARKIVDIFLKVNPNNALEQLILFHEDCPSQYFSLHNIHRGAKSPQFELLYMSAEEQFLVSEDKKRNISKRRLPDFSKITDPWCFQFVPFWIRKDSDSFDLFSQEEVSQNEEYVFDLFDVFSICSNYRYTPFAFEVFIINSNSMKAAEELKDHYESKGELYYWKVNKKYNPWLLFFVHGPNLEHIRNSSQ